MRSPLVRITSMAICSGSRPCTRQSISRTKFAWNSARGLPRVPSSRTISGDCATLPRPMILSPMLVLGIETTCDETAAAVVERTGDGLGKILSNIVLSQITEHAAFGGVVPEIAARAHVEALDLIIARAMKEAGRSFESLDGIAVAAGPGLVGGLIVGLTTAKAIALVCERPLM